MYTFMIGHISQPNVAKNIAEINNNCFYFFHQIPFLENKYYNGSWISTKALKLK